MGLEVFMVNFFCNIDLNYSVLDLASNGLHIQLIEPESSLFFEYIIGIFISSTNADTNIIL